MIKIKCKPAGLLLLIGLITSCNHRESTLYGILNKGSTDFRRVLYSPEHEVQIIYGEINGDTIVHHYFGDTGAYFYPASSIKMLNVFAALQWLQENELAINSRVFLDSSTHHPRRLSFDSLFNDSLQMDNLFRKIFVYSDNQSSNILFNLMGKDYINTLYKTIGLDTRIVHQLGENAYSFSPASNKRTSDAIVYDEGRRLSFNSSPQTFTGSLHPKNQIKGRGYIDEGGELVENSFDFSEKNYIPLKDLLGALERIVSPGFFNQSEQFNIGDDYRNKLLEIMSLKPSDLPYPIDTLADNYVKFLMLGDGDDSGYPTSLNILNKVGWAYGYLTDVAFFKDDENGISFFLAAAVHVNSNQIYNDGVYEYEEVGLPFLGELGRLIYRYELDKKLAYR